MDTTTKKSSRQRLYRIWLSYVTEGQLDKFQELRCEVIAKEAAKAIQTVLKKHDGIDVIVATIEQVAALDRAITVDEEEP